MISAVCADASDHYSFKRSQDLCVEVELQWTETPGGQFEMEVCILPATTGQKAIIERGFMEHHIHEILFSVRHGYISWGLVQLRLLETKWSDYLIFLPAQRDEE